MPVLQNNEFYCDHIGASDTDRQDVMAFSVGDKRCYKIARPRRALRDRWG